MNDTKRSVGACCTAPIDTGNGTCDRCGGTLVNPEAIYFAAIGTDGLRPVVWGVGTTESEAIAEAQNADSPHEDLRVVPINATRRARIDAGDVDASDL